MSVRIKLPNMLNFFHRRDVSIDSATAIEVQLSNVLPYAKGNGPEDDVGKSDNEQQADAFINTPIFTGAVAKFIHSILRRSSALSLNSTLTKSSASSDSLKLNLMTQYGLIGTRQDLTDPDTSAVDSLVLANMNMPWSAFICGSQGAGKSHTLSCLLENALVANNPAGKVSHPLAGMVFHYDNYVSYSSAQLCEQAYICSSGIPVTVLVSASNIWTMKRLYENLPGLKQDSPKPKVLPLYLDENRLDIQTILKLMAVDPTAKDPPLYMEVVMNIAREMAMEGQGFSYSKFRERLSNVRWVKGQETPLNLRLQLIDAIVAPSSTTKTTRPARAQENIWSFEPGSLTIVDLSDPFFSPNDACTIFSICLSIFLEERDKCGRVVVLDEAHKFLGQSGEAQILTGDLLSVIRQQRHLGTRVLIATQEPTLSPALIDLANITIVHRFLSPSWYKVLEEHLAGASKQASSDKGSLFNKIVSLRTGEALLFSPTAQLDVVKRSEGENMVKTLENDYVKIEIRKRLTADGGRSIMAADVLTDVSAHVGVEDVPMHVVSAQLNSKRKNRAVEVEDAEQRTESIDDASVTAATGQATQTSSLADSSVSPQALGLKDRDLKKELKKRGRAMFRKKWASFKPLTEHQIVQLCREIDTGLRLPPGTAEMHPTLAQLREEGLNDYLADRKRDSEKSSEANKKR